MSDVSYVPHERGRRKTLQLYATIACFIAAVIVSFYSLDFASYASTIRKFDLVTIGYILSITVVGFGLAALRLRTIASDFGYALSFRQSVATVSLGLVGGFVFFQLIGQLVARGAYLARRNIPMSGTVLITGNERIGAALVSAAMACAGALYLFGTLSIDYQLSPVRLFLGLAIVFATSAVLWRADIARAVNAITPSVVFRGVRSVALSGIVQLATMAAYVVASHAVAPDVPLASLAAASAIVMFAASMPISVAGWGLRELSAVAALSFVGVPRDGALMVAILIGAASMLLAICLALASGLPGGENRAVGPVDQSTGADRYIEPLLKLLALLATVLIFFQVHLPTASSTINANLADPVAMIGGLIFLYAIYRNGSPSWRLSGLNRHIAACTVVMTLGLFIGARHVGWTQWAVTNKYLGWFILLAYGATGALCIKAASDKLFDAFVLAGSTIIIFGIVEFIYRWSFDGTASVHFSGFAENPNSFAFQCLMVLAAALALKRNVLAYVAIAILGLWLSGSRVAAVSGCMVLIVSAIFRRSTREFILKSIFIAFAGAATVVLMSFTLGHDCATSASFICNASNPFSGPRMHSIAQHFDLLRDAWSMFTNHPIFGAGLGTFIETWVGPQKLVVHSTPLWLLAEFGLVGFLAFSIPVLRLLWQEVRLYSGNDRAGTFIVLALVAFLSMSLLHEILYQRSFWFLMGAALAMRERASPAG